MSLSQAVLRSKGEFHFQEIACAVYTMHIKSPNYVFDPLNITFGSDKQAIATKADFIGGVECDSS